MCLGSLPKAPLASSVTLSKSLRLLNLTALLWKMGIINIKSSYRVVVRAT